MEVTSRNHLFKCFTWTCSFKLGSFSSNFHISLTSLSSAISPRATSADLRRPTCRDRAAAAARPGPARGCKAPLGASRRSLYMPVPLA